MYSYVEQVKLYRMVCNLILIKQKIPEKKLQILVWQHIFFDEK
jgi:hypothetical protein